MTNEELDKLDRLAAEKVMGLDLSPILDWEYEVTNGGRKVWDGDPDLTKEGWEETGWERFEYHEERYWRRPKLIEIPVPQYTRNIAQAWELLDKLSNTIEAGLHELKKCTSHGGKYTCVLCTDFQGYPSAEAETAPLAITKACLRAVGEDVS